MTGQTTAEARQKGWPPRTGSEGAADVHHPSRHPACFGNPSASATRLFRQRDATEHPSCEGWEGRNPQRPLKGSITTPKGNRRPTGR